MKLPIKDVCLRCKKIKRYSFFEFIYVMIVRTFIYMLGLMMLVFIIIVGPVQSNQIFGSYIIQNLILDYDDKEVNYLRHLALNYTTYDGNDVETFTIELFKNLPRIRYVPVGKSDFVYNVEEVFDYGGDCKHSAALFTGMLQSVGYDALVFCGNNHCVTKVQLENEYIIVDLTSDQLMYYDNNINFWESRDKYNILMTKNNEY